MRRVLIACSLMVASLTTGCMVDRPFEDGGGGDLFSRSRDGDEAYRPIRGAVDGRLHGAIGPVSGLDHDANMLSAYDDGYYLSVETVVELENRAAMTLLSISNGAEVFRPGLDTTFTLENYDSEGVQVTVLGCVGQDVGIYDEYDMPADEAHVVVTDGGEPDEMDVSLTAVWYDRDPGSGARLQTARRAQTEFTALR